MHMACKVIKKQYNGIQLKKYEEMLGHAAASHEGIASKIQLDCANSHNEERATDQRETGFD